MVVEPLESFFQVVGYAESVLQVLEGVGCAVVAFYGVSQMFEEPGECTHAGAANTCQEDFSGGGHVWRFAYCCRVWNRRCALSVIASCFALLASCWRLWGFWRRCSMVLRSD